MCVCNENSHYPFLTAKERDNESGLDFFNARYYSSALGRFTSADTYGGKLTNPQSLNLYSYVMNNPLKWIDPTGHFAQDPNDPIKPTEDKDENGETIYVETEVEVIRVTTKAYDTDENGDLKSSWYDWVPVVGNFRQFVWEWKVRQRPGRALGYFTLAAIDGVTLGVTSTLIKQGAVRTTQRLIIKEALEEADVKIATEIVEEVPEVIYRAGKPSPSNLTPRAVDNGNLSFRNSLSNPWPLEPGQRPVFQHGDDFFGIETKYLPNGSVIPDNIPPGHVTVRGVSPDVLKDAATKTKIKGKFPK
jgi:RHS repeat-associated protein